MDRSGITRLKDAGQTGEHGCQDGKERNDRVDVIMAPVPGSCEISVSVYEKKCSGERSESQTAIAE